MLHFSFLGVGVQMSSLTIGLLIKVGQIPLVVVPTTAIHNVKSGLRAGWQSFIRDL